MVKNTLFDDDLIKATIFRLKIAKFCVILIVKSNFPVDTRRRFNVDTTSCAYWVVPFDYCWRKKATFGKTMFINDVIFVFMSVILSKVYQKNKAMSHKTSLKKLYNTPDSSWNLLIKRQIRYLDSYTQNKKQLLW